MDGPLGRCCGVEGDRKGLWWEGGGGSPAVVAVLSDLVTKWSIWPGFDEVRCGLRISRYPENSGFALFPRAAAGRKVFPFLFSLKDRHTKIILTYLCSFHSRDI